MKVMLLLPQIKSLVHHYNAYDPLEPPVRIELTTYALQVRCSTTELGRPALPPGFEPRLPVPKTGVLPLDEGRSVPLTGIEPVTLGLEVQRSIH